MAASTLPARVPDRQPESDSKTQPTWPRPAKKTSRFVIKIGGVIPT